MLDHIPKLLHLAAMAPADIPDWYSKAKRKELRDREPIPQPPQSPEGLDPDRLSKVNSSINNITYYLNHGGRPPDAEIDRISVLFEDDEEALALTLSYIEAYGQYLFALNDWDVRLEKAVYFSWRWDFCREMLAYQAELLPEASLPEMKSEKRQPDATMLEAITKDGAKTIEVDGHFYGYMLDFSDSRYVRWRVYTEDGYMITSGPTSSAEDGEIEAREAIAQHWLKSIGSTRTLDMENSGE